jgi:chromosome segregation ATPase
MKYMLDVLLVVGLLWIGWLWNGEKQAGLAMSDEIDKRNAAVARLELDLNAQQASNAKLTEELDATQAALGLASGDLKETVAALAAKTEEAETLKTAGVRLKARVAELEGYKAKAIVAEMPRSAAP